MRKSCLQIIIGHNISMCTYQCNSWGCPWGCSLRMAKGNQTGRMNGLKPQESATHSDRCAAQSTGHLAKPRPSGGNAIAIMQSSSRKAGGGSVCARPAHLNKAWNSIATGQNMGGGSHASGSPSSHV
jgi:hypothetical protein